MTGADAIVILIGLALFVTIVAYGLDAGKWIKQAGRDLDWLVERIRSLWR